MEINSCTPRNRWKLVHDIKANDSGGPVTLGTSGILSVNVSLAAGSLSGDNADWWLAMETSDGWFNFNSDIGGFSFCWFFYD